MKNIFGVNAKSQTAGGINIDGKPFVVQTVNSELKGKLDELHAALKTYQKSVLPLWLKIVFHLSFYLGLIFTLGFVSALSKRSFSEIAPRSWILFVGLALLLVCAGIWFYSKQRAKSIQSSASFHTTEDLAEKVVADSEAELGIPENAKQCDVFAYPYKVTNKGKTKPVSSFAEYRTQAVKIFCEEDALCLADLEMKLKIPFENIRRVYQVNKNAITRGWNKATDYRQGEYRPFNIRATQFGTLVIKPYCVFEIEYQNEEYELKFPCYEYKTFRAILERTGGERDKVFAEF